MSDHLREINLGKNKTAQACVGVETKTGGEKSFKEKRKARKKARKNGPAKRRADRSLALKVSDQKRGGMEKIYLGPTTETRAKLTPDPLVLFSRKNILNDAQIWAFRRIRRAVLIITDGTQLRISRFTEAAVQTSRFAPVDESEYEINMKDHYCDWMDRMTQNRLSAGPVLDIIIDEMSLSAVDRKWGKRKGWAKSHLQASLNIYGVFSSFDDRVK